MRQIVANKNLISYCGLYCGACKRYLSEKCDGCHKNQKSERWCELKKCCKQNSFNTCAECKTFTNKEELKKCNKFNNFFSKLFSLIFKSDRYACINMIKELGLENFAQEMAENKICNRPPLKK